MKSLLYSLFIVVFCLPASAQDTYLDSINVLLAANPGEERTAELLWDAAYYTLDTDETHTRQYTEPLLELPSIKADSTLLIEALRVQSDADRWSGKYAKSIENFKTCYDYYTRLQDTTNIIFCANHLGSMKVFMGYNQEAQKYIFEVYDLTKAQGDPAEIGHATNGLAIFYTNIGQDDKGIERYIEALEIFEEVQDTIGQANIHANLGLTFVEQGRFEEAYEMYTAALTIRKFKKIVHNYEADLFKLKELHTQDANIIALKIKDIQELKENYEQKLETMQIDAVLKDIINKIVYEPGC